MAECLYLNAREVEIINRGVGMLAERLCIDDHINVRRENERMVNINATLMTSLLMHLLENE